MKLIELKNVSFDYRVIGTTSTSLKEILRDISRGSVRVRPIHALSEISFSLESGQVLGVVGGNGAGKSTLLKLLAKVLPPLKGTIEVNGTIAPMISLGAGFHPEMTGNENTIFYSALVGRDIKIVKNQLHEISEWAGTTDHMEFPMRSFSSGMVARLAFSAATHERAAILLIDEVLSVGDEKFRNATKARIREQLKLGSAVVLVSHEEKLVRELCDRVLWLNKGRVEMYGATSEVMNAYQSSQS
jgi:ABC-type polysaccharide/polyol phosphate transport system ATPase subunit